MGATPIIPGWQDLPVFGIVHQFHKFRSHATIYYFSSKKHSVSVTTPAFHWQQAAALCWRAVCQLTHMTHSLTACQRAVGFESHGQLAISVKHSSTESQAPRLGVTSGGHLVPPHAPSGTNCKRCIRSLVTRAEFWRLLRVEMPLFWAASSIQKNFCECQIWVYQAALSGFCLLLQSSAAKKSLAQVPCY